MKVRMKRLQRGFVVETKFPRKAPREGANSIWGDTDLKAIARQVEDLVPQERPGTVPVKMPRILLPVEPSRHAGGSSAAEQTAAYITAAGPSVLPRSPVGNLTAEQPMDIRQTDANKQNSSRSPDLHVDLFGRCQRSCQNNLMILVRSQWTGWMR